MTKKMADANIRIVAVSATGFDKSILKISLYKSTRIEIANPESRNNTKMYLIWLSSEESSALICCLNKYFFNQFKANSSLFFARMR
jgi:hypothetical protein